MIGPWATRCGRPVDEEHYRCTRELSHAGACWAWLEEADKERETEPRMRGGEDDDPRREVWV